MKTGPGGTGVRVVRTRCAYNTHTGLFGTLERVSLNFRDAPPPGVHHIRTSAARIYFWLQNDPPSYSMASALQ
jgi:hypothetical protein